MFGTERMHVFVTKLADSHDFVLCVVDQVKLKQKYNTSIVFKNITCRLEWLSFAASTFLIIFYYVKQHMNFPR